MATRTSEIYGTSTASSRPPTPTTSATRREAHIVYGMGDNIDLIRTYPDRISYVHIKAMDPKLVKQAHDEDWPFVRKAQSGWLLSVPPPGSRKARHALSCRRKGSRDLRAGRSPLHSAAAQHAIFKVRRVPRLRRSRPVESRDADIRMIGPGGSEARIDTRRSGGRDRTPTNHSDPTFARRRRSGGAAHSVSADLISSPEIDAVMICSATAVTHAAPASSTRGTWPSTPAIHRDRALSVRFAISARTSPRRRPSGSSTCRTPFVSPSPASRRRRDQLPVRDIAMMQAGEAETGVVRLGTRNSITQRPRAATAAATGSPWTTTSVSAQRS